MRPCLGGAAAPRLLTGHGLFYQREFHRGGLGLWSPALESAVLPAARERLGTGSPAWSGQSIQGGVSRASSLVWEVWILDS